MRVSKNGQFAGYSDSRPLDITESCSLNLKSIVAFQSFCPHLATNMLSFQIAISPDEESPGSSCLVFNIRGDSSVFLKTLLGANKLTPSQSLIGATNLINGCTDRGIEQTLRGRITPVIIIWTESKFGQMT
jgi:hypothetical protein